MLFLARNTFSRRPKAGRAPGVKTRVLVTCSCSKLKHRLGFKRLTACCSVTGRLSSLTACQLPVWVFLWHYDFAKWMRQNKTGKEMLDQEFNKSPFCLWKPPPEWLPLPGPASLCIDRCHLLIYDVIIKTFSLIQCDPSPLTGGHQMAWNQQASFFIKDDNFTWTAVKGCFGKVTEFGQWKESLMRTG